MTISHDLAGRVARPIWVLTRLLAWDPETWRKLLPPGPVGCPPTPHRPGARTDRDLANELLDIYCQVLSAMGWRASRKNIHWVLSPDGYNRIRNLRDGNGHLLMTQAPFQDAKLLGWPVKISYETHEPWALCGRAGG